ncbi:unnamed protein product [Closterium sp. Naga37s-1]|nr:unnamed protein product [Closterium sp. Naga37s-1]
MQDRAHEAGQQAAGLPVNREARAHRVVSAMQGGEGCRVVSAGRGGGRVVSAGAHRVILFSSLSLHPAARVLGSMVPFKSSDVYIAKFGTLCVQPIPFPLHAVSPPALQPDGLWHFSSSVKDIPKVRVMKRG